MTAKASPESLRRTCLQCGATFSVNKPSRKQSYCDHRCAFAAKGHLARAGATTPEARRKMADSLRGRGTKTRYIKRDGQHEHRSVAAQKLGRSLMPGEIVHHEDEDTRNNDPANLTVLPSQADHARLHFAGKKKEPKTVCKNGHPLVGENVTITSKGARRCLTCQRAYDAQWKRDRRQSSQKSRETLQ